MTYEFLSIATQFLNHEFVPYMHFQLWLQMVELQPQTESGGSNISREEMIDNVAKDISERLPENFKYDEIRMKYGLDIQPTTVVLLQGSC